MQTIMTVKERLSQQRRGGRNGRPRNAAPSRISLPERGGEIMKKARPVLFAAAALLLVLFLTMFAGRLRSGEDPVRYSYDDGAGVFEFLASPGCSIFDIAISNVGGEAAVRSEIPSEFSVKVAGQGTAYVTVYYTDAESVEHTVTFELVISYSGPSMVHIQDETGRRIGTDVLIVATQAEGGT